LLVLRHENAVLRRHAGRLRYEPADRAWFTVLTRFIPRRRWAEVFPVTPATLLAWHRRLAARKCDTIRRRRPGCGNRHLNHAIHAITRRRSLLDPPRQLRARAATASQPGDVAENVSTVA
jgi:hypothetical protein